MSVVFIYVYRHTKHRYHTKHRALMEDTRNNQRFHMFPIERIKTVSALVGTLGFFSGFYKGIKVASLQYLTENSHRLPKNVGGWYFYHKKKNYVMLTLGVKSGFGLSVKFMAMISSFFMLEAGLDYLRNQIDFINTTISAAVLFSGYGHYKQLSRYQWLQYSKRGTLFGLALGIGQDLLRYNRSGEVWYLIDN